MSPRPLSELAADPSNPRTIDAPAAAGLRKSIDLFGDIAGIVYNRRTQHLVAGHQRVEQLRAAGAESWTRTGDGDGYIEHPATHERFRVRIVDWDAQTERAANLTANNPSIGGGADGPRRPDVRGRGEGAQAVRSVALAPRAVSSATRKNLTDALDEGARLAAEALPLLRAELRRLARRDASGAIVGVDDPDLVARLAECGAKVATSIAAVAIIAEETASRSEERGLLSEVLRGRIARSRPVIDVGDPPA